MSRYSPSEVPRTDLPNTQRWLREEFAQVRESTEDIYTLFNFLVANFVVAGYGSIGLAADTGLSDINATWQTLPFDTELVTDPVGIGYVLASDGLGYLLQGIWRINATIALTFTELNAGRRMQLRIFNLTTGTPIASPITFAVGRNADGVNLGLSAMVEIPEAATGNVFVLQVNSAADTFAAVVDIGASWDTNHVSEYKGDLNIESLQSREF